jgi:hypothetical protein
MVFQMNERPESSEVLSSIEDLSGSMDKYIKFAFTRPKKYVPAEIDDTPPLLDVSLTQSKRFISGRFVMSFAVITSSVAGYAFYSSSYYLVFLDWVAPLLDKLVSVIRVAL